MTQQIAYEIRKSKPRFLATTARVLISLILAGVLLLTVLALLAPATAYGATLTVNTLLDNESDGCSVNACTLREAIADATDGDSITFDAGLSGGTITLGGTQLELTKTLSIEASVPISVSANNASRVLNISSGVAVTITGLTIRDGNVTGNGGGIYTDGDLRLDASRVVSNSASSYGGGVYVNNDDLVLSDTLVLSNSADSRGGGLYVANSVARLYMYGGELRANSVFTDGLGGGLCTWSADVFMTGTLVSDNTSLHYGGGLYAHDSNASLTLRDLQVYSNSTTTRGGGVYLYQGDAVLTDTLVFSNSAQNGGGIYAREPGAWLYMYGGEVYANSADLYAGGIRIEYGHAVLSGTQVHNNSANYGGGLTVDTTNASLAMAGGQVQANSADSRGGGLYVNLGSATLDGTQVHDNSANYGGGLCIWSGSARITGTQIISNSADTRGGGLYLRTGSAVLTNTQVISNSAPEGGGLHARQAAATLTMDGGQMRANAASERGGGLYVYAGRAVLTDTQVLSNSASADGGGLYVEMGSATLNDTQLISNLANDGGAFYMANQSTAALTATNSCIVFNSDTAVENANTSNNISATNNWWGVDNGPSEAGPGDGDSINSNTTIDYSSFLTGAPTGCPSYGPADVGLNKSVSPATANPGSTITYTLTFSNAGDLVAENVVITDFVPAEVTVQNVISSGDVAITRTLSNQTAEVFETSAVSPGQGGIITITAQLSSSLSVAVFTNTATITTTSVESDTTNNNAQIEVTVSSTTPVYLPIVVKNN